MLSVLMYHNDEFGRVKVMESIERIAVALPLQLQFRFAIML